MRPEATNLRVLIAEDSEDDLILLMREFRRGGFEISFRRVDNEQDLRAALGSEPWDLVITDYVMPRLSGIDVVNIVRGVGLELPIIMVSGLMGEDLAVTAMKAGADDYILKDRMFRLVPAVEREMRDYETRRAHLRAQDELLLVNRLLETITDVDKMLVREADLPRVLSETCRILVEKAGFMMACVGRAELATGLVEPLAHFGCDGALLDSAVSAGCAAAHSGLGPSGRAIRTGASFVCADMESEPSPAPWKKAALSSGATACASFPLFVRGGVFGSLSVYSSSRGVFTSKMIDLLDSLAADIGYAIQSLEDAEERMKASQALREGEERLRTIYESAMDGMFVIDMEGRYMDVNLAGCQMVGYTRQEILSSDVSLLAFPDRPTDLDAHRRTWKSGGFLPEVPLRRKDGTTIWVDMAVTPFKVGDRDLALVVKRDITARKKVEEALRESEERFRQIFEQNQDAQVLLGCESRRVTDANPAAVALFGFAEDELRSAGSVPFLPGLRLCPEQWADRGLFSAERAEAVRKDGTKVAVSVAGQTVRLADRNVAMCTFRDLTEKLRMEEEARFIQAKLIHANKMTSIGTLASGVAHEINNPNNFILFNSVLLSDAWKDAVKILDGYYRENGDFSIGGLPYSEMIEVIPELLSGITDGSRRIKVIVDGLKDFSRAEKTPEGEVDVNKAVRAAVAMLVSQISRLTDKFEVVCSEDAPVVKGSSQKIGQVVLNLVLNALQSLPGRDRGVKVSARLDAEAGQAVIDVRDEGVGMTKEVLDRITEPFFTTRTECGGTGLGLSISYSIVKEHGGTIEFVSTPGQGTTTTVRLPLA